METFALEHISDGIVFADVKDDIQITYANKLSTSFFGWNTNTREWFGMIVSKNDFFSTIKNSVLRKTAQKEAYAIKIENRIEHVIFHFIPYKENSIVLRLEKDKKKIDLSDLHKDSSSAIVEYYPELKVLFDV